MGVGGKGILVSRAPQTEGIAWPEHHGRMRHPDNHSTESKISQTNRIEAICPSQHAFG